MPATRWLLHRVHNPLYRLILHFSSVSPKFKTYFSSVSLKKFYLAAGGGGGEEGEVR